MYQLQLKQKEYFELSNSIFPVKQSIHYREHHEYKNFVQLLGLINEVQSLIITFQHNRYEHHLHYIGEDIEIARNRALKNGGIISMVVPVDTHDGWKKAEYKILDDSKNFEDALFLAQRVVKNIGSPIAQVCGPISSGGHGNVERNLLAFHKTIQKLKKKEIVFDQMPFEPLFHKLHALWEKDNPGQYMEDILIKFYLPLFELGHIKKLRFMYDWETSRGARWEHEQAQRLTIPVDYLPKDFITLS